MVEAVEPSTRNPSIQTEPFLSSFDYSSIEQSLTFHGSYISFSFLPLATVIRSNLPLLQASSPANRNRSKSPPFSGLLSPTYTTSSPTKIRIHPASERSTSPTSPSLTSPPAPSPPLSPVLRSSSSILERPWTLLNSTVNYVRVRAGNARRTM
jgi:hypothetical protein